LKKHPHDNWGEYYDFVYERSFGSYYEGLTQATLQVISSIEPRGTIIDFGAGTGRISIPLAKDGYFVQAVEKSFGMVNEMRRKAKGLKSMLNIQNSSIAEFQGESSDLCLSLFTVLSYSISEEELIKNIEVISRAVKPNGHFFFDLPTSFFFRVGQLINIDFPDLKRVVEISEGPEEDVYVYHERCSGLFNGNEFSYEDDFKIRYWDCDFVGQLLTEHGFIDTTQVFPQFISTGSNYKLYKKQ